MTCSKWPLYFYRNATHKWNQLKSQRCAWKEMQTHPLLGPTNAPHKGAEVSTLNVVNKIIFKTLRKEFAPVADSMHDSTSWTFSRGIIITSSSENLFLGKELQQTDFGELCCPDARTVLSKGPGMAVKKKSLHCFSPCGKNDYKQAHSDCCVIFTRTFPTLPDTKCQKLSGILD